jgi:predicted nucleic acid-binding protein
MIPLRLVLDTNIIVSAALKPDGLQRTVLPLALTRLSYIDSIDHR